MTTRHLLLLLAPSLVLALAAPASAQVPVAPAPYAAGGCPAGSHLQHVGPQGPGCYERIEGRRQRPALFWPGFGAFAASYAFSVGFGYFNLDDDPNGDGPHLFAASLLPVLGPFIAAGFEDHEEDVAAQLILGGVQAIGLTLMILSHAFPERTENQVRVAFTGNGLYGVF